MDNEAYYLLGNNTGISAPCQGCSDRDVYCHSTCEKYLQFVEYNNARRAAINRHKKAIDDYYIIHERRFKRND